MNTYTWLSAPCSNLLVYYVMLLCHLGFCKPPQMLSRTGHNAGREEAAHEQRPQEHRGPHLDHRRRSKFPPGASTRVQCEPPAWHCLMGMQPPLLEPEGPAAAGKQQASGSGLPTSRPLSTCPPPPPSPVSSGESRSGHQHPKGCPSLLLFSVETRFPAPSRSPHHMPHLGLCISMTGHCGTGLGAGAQEPDLQACLALQSPPATRGHSCPAPLSENNGTQPQSPRCQAGVWQCFSAQHRTGSILTWPGSPAGWDFPRGPERFLSLSSDQEDPTESSPAQGQSSCSGQEAKGNQCSSFSWPDKDPIARPPWCPGHSHGPRWEDRPSPHRA